MPEERLFHIDEETARRLWIRSSYARLPVSQSTNLYLGVMQNANPLLPGHFVLEVKFRYPKERIREMSLLLKGQIDSSSTALRLSHPGSGFIRFHSYEHIGFFPETGIYGFMEDPNYNQFAYTIDAGVAERFQRRWPDSLLIANLFEGASADLSNHLRVAIQRLNASCDKKIAADKLLDFMIAVEALVSRERDAVSYRVALRVATLVGKDAADRQAVFEVVNSAYEERSNLAHGRPGKLTSSDAESRAFLSKIEDILARTIHFFIQAEIAKRKKEDVLRLIDTTIATQDRRTLEVTLTSKY